MFENLLKKVSSFILVAFALFLATTHSAHAVSVTQTLDLISDNYDSGGYTYSDNVSQSGTSNLRFSASNVQTHYMGTNNPSSSTGTFWAARFGTMDMPSNYVIESAYLEVTAAQNYTNAIQLTASVENTASPSSYTNLDKPSQRWTGSTSDVTSGQTISITNSWAQGERYYIDITDSVSEMVDSLNFEDVSVILKGADTVSSLRYVYNDAKDGKEPRLIINYSINEPENTTQVVVDLYTANYVDNGSTQSANVTQSGSNPLRFSASNVVSHYMGVNNPTSSTYWAAIFDEIDPMPGYEFESAYLEVTSAQNQDNYVELFAAAEYPSSPSAYADLNKPSQRWDTSTFEYLSGEFIGISDPWIKDEAYSLDISETMGEILSQGNPTGKFSFMLKGLGEVSAIRYVYNDYNPAKAPRLVINYTNPPSVEDPTYEPVVSNDLRVIEVRHFANLNDIPYHPDDIVATLSAALATATNNKVQVDIIDVINHNSARTAADDWEESFATILDENSLCSRIANEDIDQIWMWVDPRNDTVPGMEYAISSPKFRGNTATYATVPSQLFCDGEVSFVMMSYDYSREYDLALHSSSHLLEGIIGNAQGISFFWDNFTGSDACGNVHFPPNTLDDYEYNSTTQVLNGCDDWEPDGNSTFITTNCTAWGCSQGGYLNWWIGNMPTVAQSKIYNYRYLPTWVHFLIDMDETIEDYVNANFWMNPDIVNK